MDQIGLLKQISDALNKLPIPTENRHLLVTRQSFLDMGGTEKEWDDMVVEDEP